MVESHHAVFLILTMLSHICASIFFSKPRFNRWATSAIWLIYGVVFLILPGKTMTLNFYITFGVHMLLFFLTTKGKAAEKGFLFFSYACMYTCFSNIFSIADYRIDNNHVKIVLAFIIIAVMQVILYAMLLPAFRKVTPYINKSWSYYYSVIITFFLLILVQTAIPVNATMTNKECLIFLMTITTFCITYISVFNSMKNMAELSREKQKKIQTELLMTQVEAQANEVELASKNRHDLRHHNNMLLSYAKSGDMESIIDYLEKHTEQIDAQRPFRYCENETINNVLCMYRSKAEAAGIHFNATVAAKKDMVVSAPDLVAIMANVAENAFHGAQKAEAEAPMISVDIYYKAKKLVIVCDNSCNKTLDFADDMPDEMRGIGIRSICTTAEKYGGSCRFTANNGVFRCTIAITS
ncbi:MAG: GHKL domain-containing protein [Oscillospiraceae bacterium]|nr:GHKL domain-containing protein [Oscillospiraceae bacterium]